MPIHTLPDRTDVSLLYQGLRQLSWAFWLDSGSGEHLDYGGRYHILVADPRIRILSDNGLTRLYHRDGRVEETRESVLDVIRQALQVESPCLGKPPFGGGAIGYLSYDFGRRLEGLTVETGSLPEVAMGIYDWAVIADEQTGQRWIAGREGCIPKALPALLDRAQDATRAAASTGIPGGARHGLSKSRYAHAFNRIQHYLREGDCYQVNYAQRFSAPFQGDTWPLYLAMRAANPSPYGAYLSFPFGDILSSSPEQFLALRDAEVVTRPIKGTRPRSGDMRQDQRLLKALENSEKDRAENLMIVDLLRNDLGRVCVPGSIAVPELFKVESYPTVHHLVSTVTGRLAPGEDALSLLAACFPGGSITGAPKHRAMEIIQELEAYPRQIYCGSIVRIGFDGNMDSNIAIRTLQIDNGEATYHAGGGIVADSTLEEEYQESLDKAAAFFKLFNKEAQVLNDER
ncbi:aminodeoxychorismate synthase component I [Thiolapillus brandeum]|uniref:aminodeoxychorismate synthase n=1 Tax=Thiolapillus brandeum TaxID=1076588 RepID=A0A7U6GKB0_9GAMM|nr:aminodeoxychorismate synthase component I [Thiolapillus brandeum]BAO45134.1 para-aminobenzoate synthase subunit I [Thiolapillus brandeum]